MPSFKYYKYYYYILLVVAFLAYQSWRIRSADVYRVTSWMPGVGVSLTVQYAVVSLRHDDGTFEDVGRVEGSEEYVEMMRGYSAPVPQYTRDLPSHNAWPYRILRTLRKTIGQPASPDVAILSHILKSALTQPLTTPGLSLQGLPIVVSYPAIHGLSHRDIVDAASHLGVHVLSGYHLDQPRTNIAAYAGHGLGLCPFDDDYQTCRQGAMKLPVRDVLLVEYTERALFLHADTMWEADQAGGFDMYVFSDFGLGSNGSAGTEGVGEAVRRFMRMRYVDEDFVRQASSIMVMMTGSAVGREVTDAVVGAVGVVCEEVEVRDGGPVYVAARGAAEFAWRAIERNGGDEL